MSDCQDHNHDSVVAVQKVTAIDNWFGLIDAPETPLSIVRPHKTDRLDSQLQHLVLLSGMKRLFYLIAHVGVVLTARLKKWRGVDFRKL